MTKRVVAALAVIFIFLSTAIGQQTIAPEELGANMKENVDVDLAFKDKVAFIYKDKKQFPGYLKFDTEYVRCRIELKNEDDKKLIISWAGDEIDYPQDMEFKDHNLQLLWDVYFKEIQPHPLQFYGKVIEPEQSGGFQFMFIFEVEKIERVKYPRKK